MLEPQDDLFCFRVVGDTMSPGIDAGDTLTCDVAEWRRDGFAVDREYVVGLVGGPIMLRVVRPNAPADHIRLGVWNPAHATLSADVPLADVLWAARVVTITMAVGQGSEHA